MKIAELLSEGSYLIKNKDGKQKRFKDDKSKEALAWKETTSPKVTKPEQYSQAWWDAKHDKDFVAINYDSDKIYPWSKIDKNDIDDDLVQKLIKSSNTISHENVTDWHFGRQEEVTRNGVECAAISVNVSLLFTKDDDLGTDADVEEMDSIVIARNPKNPKKLELA